MIPLGLNVSTVISVAVTTVFHGTKSIINYVLKVLNPCICRMGSSVLSQQFEYLFVNPIQMSVNPSVDTGEDWVAASITPACHADDSRRAF